MLLDIQLWALDNPLSKSERVGNMMVVSRSHSVEPEFVQRLEALQKRGYKVLLVQPKELASSPMTVPTQTLDWLWTTMFIKPSSTCAECGNSETKSRISFQGKISLFFVYLIIIFHLIDPS